MTNMNTIEPIMLKHLLDYLGEDDSITILIDGREFKWNKYVYSNTLKATVPIDGKVNYFRVDEMKSIQECLSGNELSFDYDGSTYYLSFIEKRNINALMNDMFRNM